MYLSNPFYIKAPNKPQNFRQLRSKFWQNQLKYSTPKIMNSLAR